MSTMPRATLETFLDHGRAADTLTRGGVGYDDVSAARSAHHRSSRRSP
ncbi:MULTISPECIES: hypothetical protein [Actinoplanes]|nr:MULTISPECIES: hypothetical protein [Actinoplanes]